MPRSSLGVIALTRSNAESAVGVETCWMISTAVPFAHARRGSGSHDTAAVLLESVVDQRFNESVLPGLDGIVENGRQCRIDSTCAWCTSLFSFEVRKIEDRSESVYERVCNLYRLHGTSFIGTSIPSLSFERSQPSVAALHLFDSRPVVPVRLSGASQSSANLDR